MEIENPIIFRTDFSDDKAYRSVCSKVLLGAPDIGNKPQLTFVEDSRYSGMNPESLETIISKEFQYEFWFFFVIDSYCISREEFPTLAVEFQDEENLGKNQFRIIATELGTVQANLRIANLLFEEFRESMDTDGVFRGSK